MDKPQLFVATFASNLEPTLSVLLGSANKNDVPVSVLGMGCLPSHRLSFGDQGGWKKRLDAYRRFASGVRPDDVVAFVDAYDVIVTSNTESILDAFQRIIDRAAGARVVVSAEEPCDPKCCDSKRLGRIVGPEDTPFRYLCAGVVVGFASDLVELFDMFPTTAVFDDQFEWGKIWASDPRVVLDGGSLLCLNYSGDNVTRVDGGRLVLPEAIGGDSAMLPPFLHFSSFKAKFLMVRVFSNLFSDVQLLDTNIVILVLSVGCILFFLAFLGVSIALGIVASSSKVEHSSG